MRIKSRVRKYVIGLIVSSVVTTGAVGATFGKSIVDKAKNAMSDTVDTDLSQTTSKSSKQRFGAKVLRVVDGDTFVVKYNGKKTSVRLIGVDTPESVHSDVKRNTKWGKKASKYTKSKITGKTVYLEYDEDKTDPYGRILAYAYTKKNGTYTMLNKTLVKKGYARAVYYAPNKKYKTSFEKLQKQAKKSKRGFWKSGFKQAFPMVKE